MNSTRFEQIKLQQSQLSANSRNTSEKGYFRDQITNNKADKKASLLHTTLALTKPLARFFIQVK